MPLRISPRPRRRSQGVDLAAGRSGQPWVRDLRRLNYQLLPLLMLLIQLAYVFFIFFDSYRRYTGGFCPGYDAPHRSRAPFPDGADTVPRFLMAVIGAYFVVKNAQQLLAFRHATLGRHTDGMSHGLASAASAATVGNELSKRADLRDGARAAAASSNASSAASFAPRPSAPSPLPPQEAAAAAPPPPPAAAALVPWRNVTTSWIFPMYCADMLLQVRERGRAVIWELFFFGGGGKRMETRQVRGRGC